MTLLRRGSGSIRKKLSRIVAMLLGACMFLVYVTNAWLTVNNELARARAELGLLADVASHNLEAPILFNDNKGAQEVLDSLRINPHVFKAEVRDQFHTVVASFTTRMDLSDAGLLFPGLQTLSVSRPINLSSQPVPVSVGTLRVEADLGGMWLVLLTQLAQLALIMLAVLALGWVLIRRFTRQIVAPISHVASVAHTITAQQNYALRVPPGEDDELGDMASALNTMLSEIETRDQALRVAAVSFESQEGICITDADSRILRVNQSFSRITGYALEELIGETPRVLRSGMHDRAFYKAMWERIHSTGSWQGEIWDRRRNGEPFPVWLTITAVRAHDGKVTNYVATFTDITERKRADEAITQLAFYDPLTQLPNRRLLFDRLTQWLASASRNAKCGALMFIDLDKFKLLNDTKGHDIGDLLLQEVARRLQSCVRESDTVARIGGDEFIVLLNQLSDNPHQALFETEAIGEKILAALAQPFNLASFTHHCTSSIGLTLLNDHQATLDQVLRRADMAMYQAKRAGRNTLRFFDPAMQAEVDLHLHLEHMLDRALQEKQFVLYYQPQVDASGHILGAEALLRWQHPERSLVLPAGFISLAEESGQIVPIGLWVLNAACTQLKLWETDARTRHLKISVNVSPRQFRQPDFIEQVTQVLHRTGIEPSRLKLELTEGAVMENLSDAITKMQAIRQTGVQFSMDDFGTGYSSLSNLKKLPLDQLKIDQSFVQDIAHDPEDAVIVQTIIVMAHSLGMDVIAEGVETAQQRDFLMTHNCLHFQGELFSAPLPVEAFDAFVQQRNDLPHT